MRVNWISGEEESYILKHQILISYNNEELHIMFLSQRLRLEVIAEILEKGDYIVNQHPPGILLLRVLWDPGFRRITKVHLITVVNRQLAAEFGVHSPNQMKSFRF